MASERQIHLLFLISPDMQTSSRVRLKSTKPDWICLPPLVELLETDDDDDDEADAIEITSLRPQFPQTAPIDEELTRQCLQILDLGFRGKEGR